MLKDKNKEKSNNKASEKVITLDLASGKKELKSPSDLYNLYNDWLSIFDEELVLNNKTIDELNDDEKYELEILEFIRDNSVYVFENIDADTYEVTQFEVLVKEFDLYE